MKAVEFIINLVKEDKMKPVIDKVYPLSDAAYAMQFVGKGHAGGKVMIISDNRP